MTPDELIHTLRLRHRLPSAELLRALGVSRPTLMRAVRSAGDAVLTIGRTRRTSYATRRALRGSTAPLPLYRVDEAGKASDVGLLHLAHPHGCLLEGNGLDDWPLDADMRDGWFEGIPYPLQDMRPDGYLGRAFAHAHAALLQVPADPRNWSDDDTLHTLSLLGADQSGHFILGETAYRHWQSQRTQAPKGISDEQVGDTYAHLAEHALQHGQAGSSAAGEFPKFTALRNMGDQWQHVLVKFSGNDNSPTTQRWADLLVCEHLALEAASGLPGLRASRSRIHQTHGRTFLEVQRFDRHGAFGRSPMVTWAAVNHDLVGLAGRPWPQGADRLLALGFIEAATRDAAALQWHYGQLIGNSDMHDGNLSFMPVATAGSPQLQLTPMYDMLPMCHAPLRGVELRDTPFVPQPPLPAELPLWTQAARCAEQFWALACADARISTAFRHACERNAQAVRLCARTFELG